MFNIEAAYINAYKDGLQLAFQQKQSRTAPYVEIGTQNSEFAFYDRIGVADDVNEIITRYGDTPMNEVPHNRRRIGMRDFDWAKLVDKKDLIRVLNDPTSAYTQSAVMAFNRKFDDLVFEAAYGDAFIGKEGNTTISFVGESSGAVAQGNNVTTEGICVSSTYVDGGTPTGTNLTLDKLRVTRAAMMATEAIDPDSTLTIFVNSYQLMGLVDLTDVKSAEYSHVKALADGKITEYMGYRFVLSERIPKIGNIRHNLVIAPGAIRMVTGKDLEVDIRPRPDKRNIPQIYLRKSMSGTRMWGELTAAILCDETAGFRRPDPS